MGKFFKILGIIFFTISILFVLAILILLIKFNIWEREFVANINPDNMATEAAQPEEMIIEKIEDYVISGEIVEFISFSPKQIAKIIYGSISEMLGESDIKVTNIYIEPSLGTWQVCARGQSKRFDRINLWICADVTKDNMQTAQLYLSDLYIQGLSIGKIYKPLLVEINQGIAEALVTANENGFVGRIFQNIEFLENEVIIKGALY